MNRRKSTARADQSTLNVLCFKEIELIVCRNLTAEGSLKNLS